MIGEINIIPGQRKVKKGKKSDRKFHEFKNWDSCIPKQEYFNELFRISKNQIIFGANYFVKYLKEGHKGWLIWDKGQHGLTMSDCELAYTSFDSPTRVYTKNRVFLMQEGSVHPTQKPIGLYKFALKNYAKKGDKIFDSHVGSGSSRIACYDLGFDFEGCEIGKDYWQAQEDRFNKHVSQLSLFTPEELEPQEYNQANLF